MTTRPFNVLLALSLIAGFPGNGRAQGKVIDDGPQNLSQVSSIGDSLQNAGQAPLHILYVHGIGATSPGDSQIFQKKICAFLKGCKVPVAMGRDYADSGLFEDGADPPAFEYMGNTVWTSKDEWSASAPFVDHYVLRRSDGGPVVVDEINWWPLVLPPKCRDIMTGEARLAGPDKTLLNLCSQSKVDASHSGRFISYPWISAQDAKTLESIHPKGARINRSLKTSLLDWGFSDAIMAVGSMHDLFREGMRQLFVKSARFNADGSKTDDWEQQSGDPHRIDREFIVVSHSLGSYLVFSTLDNGQHDAVPKNARTQSNSDEAKEDNAARYILERTSLVYFFANQVPLLELANMVEPKAAALADPGAVAQSEANGAVSERMRAWKDLRQAAAKPRQVIAWSDPSDLLSWRVPAMDGLVIDNLYVRNTWWHWLIANPGPAHGNYDRNKNVLRIMMGSNESGAKDGAAK